MNFKVLLQELSKYETSFKEEKDYINKLNSFLNFNNDIFYSNNCIEGHITASGWLLNTCYDKTLLIWHKKLNKLLQLGGHCEEYDTCVKNAALRELYEESGLKEINFLKDSIFDIDIHLIPSRNGIPSHYHYDIRYLFVCDDSQEISSSSESVFIKWYKIKELRKDKNIDSSIKRMIKKTKLYLTEV